MLYHLATQTNVHGPYSPNYYSSKILKDFYSSKIEFFSVIFKLNMCFYILPYILK